MVIKGTLDGPVLKPGNTADSYLYELITLDEDDADVMPSKGGKLTPEQIESYGTYDIDPFKVNTGYDPFEEYGQQRNGK